MNALHSTTCLAFTGLGHHIQKITDVLRELQQRGVRIEMATSQNSNLEFSGDFELALRSQGWQYHFLPDLIDEAALDTIAAEARDLERFFADMRERYDDSLYTYVSDLSLTEGMYEAAENFVLLEKLLDVTTPDFVIVLHEANFWTKPLAYLAYRRGIPVFSFQEGHYEYGLHPMAVRCLSEFSARVFLWGAHIQEIFAAAVDDPARIVVSGPLHADEMLRNLRVFDQAAFRREQKLPDNCRIAVMFLPHLVNTQLERQIENFAALMRRLGMIGICKFRQHTNFDQFEYLRARFEREDVRFYYDVDPYPLLFAADFVFVGYTTATLEALLCKKPIIYIKDPDPNLPKVYESVAVYTTSLIEADELPRLEQAIRAFDAQAYRENLAGAESFLAERVYAADGRVMERILTEIESYISENKRAAVNAAQTSDDPQLKISIIIPTYNRAPILLQSLQALAQQTLPFEQFEVLICDDGSTDDTERIVQAFDAPFYLSYLKQENRGPAAARNLGLRLARGAYALILNDDAIAEPDLIEQHLQTHATMGTSNIAVLGSFAFPDYHRETLLGDLLESCGVLFEFFRLRAGELHPYHYFFTCNISLPLESIRQVGLFDEEFDLPAGEDIELGYRLFRRGLRVFYNPKCVTWHNHAISAEDLGKVSYMRGKAQPLLLSKHPEINFFRNFRSDDYTRWRESSILPAENVQKIEALLAETAAMGITFEKLREVDAEGAEALKNMAFAIRNHYHTLGMIDNPLFSEVCPFDGGAEWPKPEIVALAYVSSSGKDIVNIAREVLGQDLDAFVIVYLYAEDSPIAESDVRQLRFLFPGLHFVLQPIARNTVDTDVFRNVLQRSAAEFALVWDTELAIPERFAENALKLLDNNAAYSAIAYDPAASGSSAQPVHTEAGDVPSFQAEIKAGIALVARKSPILESAKFINAASGAAFATSLLAAAHQTGQSWARIGSDYRPERTSASTSPRLNILFTMYGWQESGGGTMFPRDVALRLARFGHTVTVFYAAGSLAQQQPYHVDERVEDGVRLVGVYNRPAVFLDAENPLREIRDERIMEIFGRLLDDIRPDVVHFHNFLGLSFAIAQEAQNRGIPSFYTPHNYHLVDPMLYRMRGNLTSWPDTNFFEHSELARRYPEKNAEYKKRIAAARAVLRTHVDYTLAISRHVGAVLEEFGGSGDRIHVVHQSPQSAERLQPASGSAQLPLRVGFIGSVLPNKGVHILIAAAQILDAGVCSLHIYGDGPEAYIRQLRELDQAGAATFHGAYRPAELADIGIALDVMVVPSVWEEGAGLVIPESLTLGIPVVAARIGGIPDFVEDGVNGLLYTHDAPAELARHLHSLAVKPALFDRLRANCALSLSFDDYVRHMEKLYRTSASGVALRRADIELLFHQVAANGAESFEPMTTNIDAAQQRAQHTEPVQTGEPLNRLQFEQAFDGGFSNKRASGVLPDPLPTPLYLNLGCGRDVREGFINIDLFSEDSRVVFGDVRKLDMPDNCADGILASDILEHFSHRETNAILQEWARILKPGGELTVRCPSLRLQAQAYVNGAWDADVASYMIFGGQTNPGDYHCIAFDERSIRAHLAKVGLEVFDFEERDIPQDKGYINLNMTVRSRKPVPASRAADFAAAAHKLTEKIEHSAAAADRGGKNVIEGVSAVQPLLNIVWEGSQFVRHSFAVINREHCSNLIDTGLAEVTILPYEEDTFAPEGNAKFEKLKAHDLRYKADIDEAVKKLPYLWIRHQWPPKEEPPRGAKWVVMQPWEFSTTRRRYADLFNQADEVWVPSTFTRNAYVRSGVTPSKVQVVPNGIDPDLFTPFGVRYPLKTQKSLRLLYVGGTIFRKGVDIALEAYAKAFTADDDVCFVIKDMGGDSFYRGITAAEAIENFRRNPATPEIEYLNDELTDDEMAALYRACHVLVSPYRGEGFSLPTLEAMASGLAVMVTKGGATDDFVDDEVGWPIPAEERSIGETLDGEPLTSEGFVFEPDVDALIDAMQQAYRYPAIVAECGVTGALRARTEWTWKRATLKLLARIDALQGMDLATRADTTLESKEDGIIAFARAEAAYSAGDKDEAIRCYNQAIVDRGLSEEYALTTFHRLAYLSVEENSMDLVAEFLDKADDVQPDHPDTKYMRALVHMLEGRWEEARTLLERLIDNWDRFRFQSRIGFGSDTLNCDIGRCMFELGAIEEAKARYEKAVEINRESADAYFGIAQCFRAMGVPNEAKKLLEAVLAMRPGFALAEQELEQITNAKG